jgi:hypothetical protein
MTTYQQIQQSHGVPVCNHKGTIRYYQQPMINQSIGEGLVITPAERAELTATVRCAECGRKLTITPSSVTEL